ncbi:MAG: copper ion binding protein, partial [Candidatus Methanofastidiosia archaeon]
MKDNIHDKSNRRIDLGISGMTCASCVSTIEGGLSEVKGVEKVEVNLATEKASVIFDPELTKVNHLVSKVKELGYDVRIEKVTLPITGMSCASCVTTIEESLSNLEGVLSASVNLATERGTVEYMPTQVSLSDMKRAIEDVGYGVLEIEEKAVDREREARMRELKVLQRKFSFAAILGFLSLVGTYQAFFPIISEIPRQNMFYILFLLTTPVQFWAGAQFYRGFFASLKHKTADMNTLIAVGTSAAYFYSVAATFLPDFFVKGTLDVYYDTAAVIIALILLGRLLEVRAKGKTSEAIKKLMGLQAKTARVLRDGEEIDIPLEEVRVGDVVLVR